jgi:MFS family permease
LIFGTGIWGIWTIVVGLMPSFTVCWCAGDFGLGLGCLMPATFSLLGDHYPQASVFCPGGDRFVGLMGTVLGCPAGFVANRSCGDGFCCPGDFQHSVRVVIWLFVDEPPRGAADLNWQV